MAAFIQSYSDGRNALRRIAIGLTASVVLLAGGLAADEATAQGEVQMFLPVGSAAWSFYLADKKGYFTDEGLNIDIRVFNSGGEAGRAFHALKAEMLEQGDLTSMVFLEASDGAATMVAQVARVENGIQLIGPTGMTVAEDLKGKRIGTNFGSSTEYFLQQYLRENNLTDQVTVINLDPGSHIAALVRGDVDAIVTFLEIAAAFSDPNYHLVQGWASSLMLSVSTDFLRANSEDVMKVLRALDRAASDIEADSEAAISAVSGDYGVVDEAYAAYLDQGVDYRPQFNEQTHEVLQGISALLVENGRLKGPFDFCRFVALEPLQQVRPDEANADLGCN